MFALDEDHQLVEVKRFGVKQVADVVAKALYAPHTLYHSFESLLGRIKVLLKYLGRLQHSKHIVNTPLAVTPRKPPINHLAEQFLINLLYLLEVLHFLVVVNE